MIVLLGDSNVEFNGHGWLKGFGRMKHTYPMVSLPGGSSSPILGVAAVPEVIAATMADIARHDPHHIDFIVTTGINDMIQDVGIIRYVKNHLAILKVIKHMMVTRHPYRVFFMPSHYTGHWKLEIRRLALQVVCMFSDAHFIDLSPWKQYTVYNADDDPWHLQEASYEKLAQIVMVRHLA